MDIRRRTQQDLATLAPIAVAVHETDGYPLYRPDDDIEGFLDSPELLDSWVAELDGRLVGHIALHSRSSQPVLDLASRKLETEPNELGVIARLLVVPSAQRSGVASALLAEATQDCRRRGLTPILDVVNQFAPAIALYEHHGWTRLGTVQLTFPNDFTITEHVYAAPSTAETSESNAGFISP